jgi:hypothetical protein
MASAASPKGIPTFATPCREHGAELAKTVRPDRSPDAAE